MGWLLRIWWIILGRMMGWRGNFWGVWLFVVLNVVERFFGIVEVESINRDQLEIRNVLIKHA
jgi:hypothetical protein